MRWDGGSGSRLGVGVRIGAVGLEHLLFDNRLREVQPKQGVQKAMRRHIIGIACVVSCILFAYAPGLVPGKSALVSHHAGNLDTIYRQARADGVSFGTALDDPAPSWQWEPLDAVATEAFRNHEWPLWQPYNGFGSPLLATLDSSVFSPTKLLLYLGVTDNRTWVFVAHLIIAGTFSYAVGAAWGMHSLASASFAVCFTLASYFTGTRDYPQAISASLLPVAVWAGHRVATDRPGGIPTLGIVLGILVLSGHPEASLAMIIASGIYGLTLAYSSDRWQRLRKRDSQSAIRFILAATIGAATSMIVVLPLLGIVTDTVSHVRAKPVEGLLDPRLLTSILTFITSIFVPTPEMKAWMDQSIWHAAYMGPLAAVVALAMPKKIRLPTVALGALMGLMLVISALTPPHGLLRGLIYFESYYAVAIGTWVVAALTGSGLTALLTRPHEETSRLFAFARAALIAINVLSSAIALIFLNGISWTLPSNQSNITILIWILPPLVATASTTATSQHQTTRRIGALFAAATSVFWLVAWTGLHLNFVKRPDGNISSPLAISHDPASADQLARVTGLDSTTLQGNSASNWKLHDLKLSGAFHTCRFLEFAALASNPPKRDPCNALSDEINVTLTGASSRGLHLAGVSTILYPPARTTAFPSPPVEASLTYADRYVAAATLNRTLPRAYLIRRARSCEHPVHDALDAIFSQEFDPFTEVFLEPGIPPGNRDLAPVVDHDWRTACPVTQLELDGSTINAVDPTDYRHTSVTFDLDVDSQAWLVLLDRNAPGWTATTDGVPTPISTANALFRAVRVEPTSHRIEFRYWPSWFTTGLTITLTTIAGAALALIAALYRAVRSGSREDVVAVTAGLVFTVAQAGTILDFAPR